MNSLSFSALLSKGRRAARGLSVDADPGEALRYLIQDPHWPFWRGNLSSHPPSALLQLFIYLRISALGRSESHRFTFFITAPLAIGTPSRRFDIHRRASHASWLSQYCKAFSFPDGQVQPDIPYLEQALHREPLPNTPFRISFRLQQNILQPSVEHINSRPSLPFHPFAILCGRSKMPLFK
ncbi:hypothetical protein LMH87_006245 [Akanthomyces muscarius]|uniref:Uncharacterized protein n=1 Tax=Akanthomyces muscarius TaxID=2231603 RepID=A0A9W8URB7_AKAMU|nr:hypothetical protein LMH87_006245 [Akanthomyces muscarius]KAJ4164576.1 hypothetical protein LMH87_006245 [Akanthomyces muscarius]